MASPGRPCSVCKHAQRKAIDSLLITGARTVSEIVTEFGLKSAALYRHKRNHLNAAAPRRVRAGKISQGKHPPPVSVPVDVERIATSRLDELNGAELQWLDDLAVRVFGEAVPRYGRALAHTHLRAEAKFGQVAKKSLEEDSFYAADRTFTAARGLTADVSSIAKMVDPQSHTPAIHMEVNVGAEIQALRAEVLAKGRSPQARLEAAEVLLIESPADAASEEI